MYYELTITLRPQMYRFSAVDQYVKSKCLLQNHLSNFKCSLVAELTQANNIHYHGIVDLKDLIHRDQLLNKFRGSLVFGKMTCTQLINETKWIEYLRKDLAVTRQIINNNPIIMDDLEKVEIPIKTESLTWFFEKIEPKYNIKVI